MVAHLCCAIVVYLLAIRLLKSPTQAFIAALIWAIHPTHVENVAWISGRTDIIAGLFYFLAMYLFLGWMTRAKGTRLYLSAVCGCYALALLSKEMAVTLPFLVVIACFLFRDESRGVGSMMTALIILVVLTVVYFLVRQSVLGYLASASLSHTWSEILLSALMVFARYLGLVFGFVPVDPHHADMALKSAWSLSFVVYALIASGCAAVLYMAWRWRERILFFCLAWFPVTLLPVFALGGFGDILYADRFLYIPSVGLIFGSVAFVYRFVSRKNKLAKAVAGLLCLGYLGVNTAYSRTCSAYWRDDLSLFSQAARTSPDSAYIHFNLGNVLSYAESYEKSLDAYNRAISLFPRYVEAHTTRAFVLNRLERYEEALASSKKAIQLRGIDFATLNNIGDSLMSLGDAGGAEKSYIGSLALRETAFGHHQLAICLMEQGKMDEAYAHFMKALSIKMNPRILNNLARLYLKKGDPDNALLYAECGFGRLKTHVPSNIKLQIHYTTARALMEKGSAEKADFHIRKASELISLGYGAPSLRAEIIQWIGNHGIPGPDRKKTGMGETAE
jgi:protein O-mannosyl-transferase